MLVVVAILNLTGSPIRWTATWVIELLLLVVVGLVTYGQVFPARGLKRRWTSADDERLRRIDVDALMKAASAAFPRWLRPLHVVRFVLATAGSAVVIVLLLLRL